MIPLAVCAVYNPTGAVAFSCNGTTHQVFLGPCHRDRLAPFAVPVILDEQLVAELRRVERPKVLRLLLELRRLDATALLLDVIADVRQPERAVRPVSGCWEVVFGL